MEVARWFEFVNRLGMCYFAIGLLVYLQLEVSVHFSDPSWGLAFTYFIVG